MTTTLDPVRSRIETLEEFETRLRENKLDPIFGRYGLFESESEFKGGACFWGNFQDYSAVFHVDTDEPQVIARIRGLILANRGFPEALTEMRKYLAEVEAERNELKNRKLEEVPS